MSKLSDAIANYKTANDLAAINLKQAICDALHENGFGDIEEASVAFVSGHAIVFAAYVCVDLDEPQPVTLNDIDVNDNNISLDSIILQV